MKAQLRLAAALVWCDLLCIGLLCFTMQNAQAQTQQETDLQHAKELPGLTASFLAHISESGYFTAAIHLENPTQELSRRHLIPLHLEERDSWWLLPLPNDNVGMPHVVDLKTAFRPDAVTTDRNGTVWLYIDYPKHHLKGGDKTENAVSTLNVFARTTSGYVCPSLTSGIALKQPAAIPFAVNPGLDYAPDQEMRNGARRSALHIPLKLQMLRIWPEARIGQLDFVSDNLFSTENDDRSTRLNLALNWSHYVDQVSPDTFLNLSSTLQYKAAQSLRSQSVLFGTGVRFGIPGRFPRGNTISFNSPPKIQLVPLLYEHRLRLDLIASPTHTQYDVFRSSAELLWDRILLFSPAGSDEDSSVSLSLRAKGWWLPGEQALSGLRAHHWEGRFDIDLSVPFSVLGLNRVPWIGAVQAALVFHYGAGANEAQDFAQDSAFTVGVQFGKKYR